MCILALADDLTGALEIGAKFSNAGIETIVSAKPLSAESATAVVLDTETRHVGVETAYREICRFVEANGGFEPRLIYKKTDSTLRGNIAAELRALAHLYPEWRIGYAPAYPALGRTVKDGVLYVHGRPVAETEFARDALNPVRHSCFAALLGPDLACRVFDGETDDHLADAAQEILSDREMRIAAGPAGLAEQLALVMNVPRQELIFLPRVRTCVVMNGSRHERSAAQIRRFRKAEWPVLNPSAQTSSDPFEVAMANGSHVVAELALRNSDAALVIGGDTAFAFIRELGFPTMIPIAEAVPGIPVTRIRAADLQQALPGRNRDLILITKAGGFGDLDALAGVHSTLSREHGT